LKKLGITIFIPVLFNAGIPCQNEDGFKQYPQRQVHLPSLLIRLL